MSYHPVHTCMLCDFPEFTHTDGQACPAPPNLPMSPNYGESGTLPVLPFIGIPVAGSPLVNSIPPESTVPLPASGISTGDSSSNTYSFTCVDAGHTASNLPVAFPPGTSKKKFRCNDCGAKYVQRQGLNRHRIEKHEPNLCRYCGAKWARPYEYRDHLKKHHPDVDRDIELGKAAGSRCRSAIFVRRRSQQVSLPAIEHGRRGHSGIRPYPPAVVKPSPSTAALPPPIMTSNGIPEGAVNCIILFYLFS